MGNMAMAAPIYNPPVPFKGPITGGLQDGMSVTVTGQIHPNANDFRIDLLCGSHYNADVAFVFNPRFSQNEIVRNTQNNGQWGAEEKFGGFPVSKGGQFNIRIDVTPREYKVYMNARHFCDYRHRTPMHRVDAISIEGSISITMVKMENRMPIPFKSNIPGGMYPGKMVHISGTPTLFSKQFAVNLQVGQYEVDVPLHFNPRFWKNHVVRNSMQRSGWGPEETAQPFFPFAPNRKFEIIILCEHHQFKVAVNGQHFIEFRHRYMQLNQIDTIAISGDVVIEEVKVQ